jgi:hypothetical protein
MKAEILYKSKGTTLAGDPFLTVKKARDYYEYSERGGRDSIAFVLYDKNTDKFLLINESKPPLDEASGELVKLTTAFGGSLDNPDVSKEDIVQQEVLEEAGYKVHMNNIHFVGETMVSTQMSQMCYLYLVDVTNTEKTHKAEYETEDKNNEFNGNSVHWMSTEDVVDNQDWKSIFIMARAIFKDLI